MPELIMPGYDIEVPNTVFSRSITPVEVVSPNQVFQEIIMIDKYSDPTHTQILERIRLLAAKSLEHIIPSTDREGLEAFIANLQYPTKKSMATKGAIYNEIQSCLPENCFMDESEQKKYIKIDAGIIGTREYLEQRSLAPALTPEWYESVINDEQLINRDMGPQWVVRLILTDNHLPPRPYIEFLMRHNVPTSDIFMADSDIVINSLRGPVLACYDTLKQPEGIECLRDISAMKADMTAFEAIKTVLKMRQATRTKPEESQKQEESRLLNKDEQRMYN